MQKDLPGGFGAFVLVAALVVGPCRVHAQDLPSEQLDSLRAELELLRAQLDSLGAVVASGPVSPEVGDQEETTDALAPAQGGGPGRRGWCRSRHGGPDTGRPGIRRSRTVVTGAEPGDQLEWGRLRVHSK